MTIVQRIITVVLATTMLLGALRSTTAVTPVPVAVADTNTAANRVPKIVKFYGPGKFLRVLHVRQRQGFPVNYNGGYLASTPAMHIGEYVLVRFALPRGEKSDVLAGGHYYGPVIRFMVVDVAQPRDYARQVSEGLGLEVPYFVAVEHGFADQGKSLVLIEGFEKQ